MRPLQVHASKCGRVCGIASGEVVGVRKGAGPFQDEGPVVVGFHAPSIAENETARPDVRLRAEIRAGELLAEMEKNKGVAGQAEGRKVSGGIKLRPPETKSAPTLSDLGITKTQSSRWQKLAALPVAEREQKVATAKQKAQRAVDAR